MLDVTRHLAIGASNALNNDGSTDNLAAFQTILDNVAASGAKSEELFFPEGTYRVTDTVNIPVAARGLKLRGTSRGDTAGTVLHNAATDGSSLLGTTGASSLVYLEISDLRFSGASGAGHIFNPATATLISQCAIRRCYAALPTASASFINIDGIEHAHFTVEDCQVVAAASASVPIAKHHGPVDSNMSNVRYLNCKFNGVSGMTAPLIECQNNHTIGCVGFMFQNVSFEQAHGGALHLYGLHSPLLMSLGSFDLGSAPSAPQILFDTAVSGQIMADPTMIGCFLSGGDASNPDVKMSGAGPGIFPVSPVLIGCFVSQMDWGSSSGVAVGCRFSNQQGEAPVRMSHGTMSGVDAIWSTNDAGMANRPRNLSGSVTLSSGTGAVSFPTFNEPDANYRIVLSGNAAESFHWSSKAVDGFTITSSNGSSTAVVDWMIIR